MRGYGERREGAGIVLAGGRSTRMGTPKADLDWHGTPLLTRTVAVLGRAVAGPVVVVRAAGQALPSLPPGTEVLDDAVPGLGPLPAIGAGLGAAAGWPAAFVASTDLPMLHPGFAARMLDLLRPALGVVLPVAHGHHQPLAAAYRTALAAPIAELTAAGQGRPPSLFERVRVRRVGEEALRADPVLARVDPRLESLTNVNTPAEYAAALARPLPTVRLHSGGRARTVRAASAGGLPGPAVRSGSTVGPDGPLPTWFPLVTGDEVEQV